MAFSSIYLLTIISLFLFPTMSISTSLKSMHFTFYQHDIVNKTDFMIIKGITGADLSLTASPFGSIFILHDPLTISPDPSSDLIGHAEGATITSSFDGLDNLSIGKFTLNFRAHKGSFSVLGSVNNLKPSDIPVVGGTGDFMFVQGFLRSSLVDIKGLYFVYKVEANLYWPPFATTL
ncbi:dirigent protein-like [Amaranthus tricolor]|uniref:dirigent protein-like n=1 Tax=Amaranthus tricolor TaxID=29722 RepID=UPI00258F59D3|nr:dirigent protein-like [Amaranthus tricolor]